MSMLSFAQWNQIQTKFTPRFAGNYNMADRAASLGGSADAVFARAVQHIPYGQRNVEIYDGESGSFKNEYVFATPPPRY